MGRLHGLSVSEKGFVAIFKTGDRCLSVRVDGERDSSGSPQALTLLQLFQGIDLAGYVLPPDILSTRFAEQTDMPIVHDGETYSFREASLWIRAQCLDQLPRFMLTRMVARLEPGHGLQFDAFCTRIGTQRQHILEDLDPFEAVALSIRCKLNVEIVHDVLVQLSFPSVELRERFPFWISTTDASAQAARVSSVIAKSSKIAELEGAKRIALEKGDSAAAQRIQAAIDELGQIRLAEGIDPIESASAVNQTPLTSGAQAVMMAVLESLASSNRTSAE